mmetsp:Transcript_17088/g.55890  ORF Transcript_17088/g.55890 Transcript_17088/m.55890 type:complete len:540 (+) Transcript_17088:8-1627(+)
MSARSAPASFLASKARVPNRRHAARAAPKPAISPRAAAYGEHSVMFTEEDLKRPLDGERWAKDEARASLDETLEGEEALPVSAGAPKVTATTESENISESVPGYHLLYDALDAGLGSIILLAATFASLILANSAIGHPYLEFWEFHIGPAALGLSMPVREWVNEGAMSLFFFVVGMEIKREFVFGALASIRKAILPCLGALGGMIVPMLVYCGLNATSKAGVMAGWAIPMATDIAFAMGCYNFFRNRMPPGAAAFLLTLATVDDLGAIAVIAICFTGSVVAPYLAGAVGACGLLYLMERQKVSNLAYYALTGVALWYCLLQGGINADIAGVATAMAIPASLEAPPHTKAESEHGPPDAHPTLLDHLVHWWLPITSLFIMPLFALANTAVHIDFNMISGLWTQPVSLGIIGGLVLGKPLGIAGLSLLGIKLGWASWPVGMQLPHLLTMGLLGGIGFTMSLFLIEMSLPHGAVAATAKLAILCASILAAVLGMGAMRFGFPIYFAEQHNTLVDDHPNKQSAQARAAEAQAWINNWRSQLAH